MRKSVRCRLLILMLLLLPSNTCSETITGKVIKVADGDTITILTPGNEQIKIRLSAVDTPEGGQAHGRKAKQFTSRMVYKKNVQVKTETIDRYGRIKVKLVPLRLPHVVSQQYIFKFLLRLHFRILKEKLLYLSYHGNIKISIGENVPKNKFPWKNCRHS